MWTDLMISAVGICDAQGQIPDIGFVADDGRRAETASSGKMIAYDHIP
jgi:hypothetical protein